MKTAYRLILAVVVVGMFNLAAMVHAEDYTYTTNNGTITITKYTGPGGDVTIPSIINGLPVTNVGSSASYGCTSLNTIFSPTASAIQSDAFTLCTSLKTMAIPSSVREISC